mmetsp:Transcript_38960/g.62441  ORF Transcript_38960/g.62441 Transcript_38960/m.62441 type:complete len:112 (-) Transcript_38960:197-532(-)
MKRLFSADMEQQKRQGHSCLSTCAAYLPVYCILSMTSLRMVMMTVQECQKASDSRLGMNPTIKLSVEQYCQQAGQSTQRRRDTNTTSTLRQENHSGTHLLRAAICFSEQSI